MHIETAKAKQYKTYVRIMYDTLKGCRPSCLFSQNHK